MNKLIELAYNEGLIVGFALGVLSVVSLAALILSVLK